MPNKEKVENKTADGLSQDWQNKTLRTILIGGIIVLVSFAIAVIIINNLKTIEYEELKFEKKVVGNVVFYETDFPVFKDNKNLTYQLFIRTDPETLKDVSFDGTISGKPTMVLNTTNELNCEGDGVIALANMYQLFPYIGIDVVSDPNASCDSQDRYMFVNLINSTQTKITQTEESCYQIDVNNCEVLKATERFMVEVLLKRKENLGI